MRVGKKRGASKNPDIETSIEETISHSRCLRVLDYGKYCEGYVCPKDINHLINLRYLCCLCAKTVPNFLCKLLNLQYLDLTLSQIDEFPDDIGNLKNLRVLISSSEITFLPEGIRNLASLRKLIIKDSSKLRSMGSGLGCITSLEHLEISNCPRLEFSNNDFPGLSSLKKLVLSHLPTLEHLPMGLQDTAATLKHLTLRGCSNLTLTEEVLPNLRSLELLEIANCESIIVLPRGIQDLRKLTHFSIDGSSHLANRCNPEGEDWHKIDHVPHVHVGGRDAWSIENVQNLGVSLHFNPFINMG